MKFSAVAHAALKATACFLQIIKIEACRSDLGRTDHPHHIWLLRGQQQQPTGTVWVVIYEAMHGMALLIRCTCNSAKLAAASFKQTSHTGSANFYSGAYVHVNEYKLRAQLLQSVYSVRKTRCLCAHERCITNVLLREHEHDAQVCSLFAAGLTEKNTNTEQSRELDHFCDHEVFRTVL